MIVGKDFVILNMPKTGTCFRNRVASQYTYKRLCPAWCKGMQVVSNFLYSSTNVGSRLRIKHRKKFLDGHYIQKGIYKILIYVNHCPEHLLMSSIYHISAKRGYNIYDLRGKEVLSVLRNPYSQSISLYQYRRQKKSKTKQKNYTFVHYVKYASQQRVACEIQGSFGIEHTDYPLGALSHQFIRMHFKDPAKIFTMSAEAFEEYCISDDYKKDMYPIKFFRTETMNRQLCEYLKSKPYLDSQIIDEIFKETTPQNVSKKRTDAVWDEETKAHFEKTEKFYIRMVQELAPLPEDDF